MVVKAVVPGPYVATPHAAFLARAMFPKHEDHRLGGSPSSVAMEPKAAAQRKRLAFREPGHSALGVVEQVLVSADVDYAREWPFPQVPALVLRQKSDGDRTVRRESPRCKGLSLIETSGARWAEAPLIEVANDHPLRSWCWVEPPLAPACPANPVVEPEAAPERLRSKPEMPRLLDVRPRFKDPGGMSQLRDLQPAQEMGGTFPTASHTCPHRSQQHRHPHHPVSARRVFAMAGSITQLGSITQA
jgi:hypothetical protein